MVMWLDSVSYVILCGIAAYIWIQYVLGSWILWAESPKRLLFTCLVSLYWIAQGVFFLSLVPALQINQIGFVAFALFLPPTAVCIALLTSDAARRSADRISLKWAIETVEGPARIVVGILFIVWFFLGKLPPIFTWVAGPGDIIGGVLAIIAVYLLKPVANYVKIERNHWSAKDVVDALPKYIPPEDARMLLNRVNIALAFVAVGIADFFAAPASAAISFIVGSPATALSKRPLGFVPMLLVPMAFAMEVVAVRQLRQLKRLISEAAKEVEVVHV